MLEILNYDFMIRALWIGGLASVVAGVMGNFMVAGRNSFTFEMISHGALAGVGVGFFFELPPNLMAFLFSIITVTLLMVMSRGRRELNEASAMLLLSGGVAVALLFSHLAKNNPVSFHRFLFGSILTIGFEEMVWFSILSLMLLILFLLFWNRLVGVVFYPIACLRTTSRLAYEILLMLMMGTLAAWSLQIMGGLLLGALLIISVLTVQSLARNFLQSVLWTVLFNLVGVTGGIVASFYLDLPTSSSIVLSLILLFLLTRPLARTVGTS